MMIELFVIGLISILGQIALLRELIVAFFGVELIYLLAMGTWLVWSALGAAWGRSRLPSPGSLRVLFFLFSILLPSQVAAIRGIDTLWGAVPGAYLPIGHQVPAMALSLLPTGFLSGLIFQWAARRYVDGGRTLAAAYAVESAGGMVGGLASTGLLAAGLSNFTIAVACAMAALCTAVAVGRRKPLSGRWAVLIVLVLLAVLAASPAMDRKMTAWRYPDLRVSKDSPYGRITITGRAGQKVLYENGALGFETETTFAEEFVQLAALQHPAPQRVLLLGGFASGLPGEIEKLRPLQLDVVEINPVLPALARRSLFDAKSEPLHGKETAILIDDPRRFLQRAPSYDLILAAFPEPVSGQSNRFYTLEFFQACARHLNPTGVFAFRLSGAENLWPRPLVFRNASVYRSLARAFADVLVLPGTDTLFIASDSPLERDPRVPIHRWLQRRIEARLVSPPFIRYMMTNDRVAQIKTLLTSAQGPLNLDRRPICYPYSMIIWLSQFFPKMINWAQIPGTDAAVRGWPVLAVAACLFFALRRAPRWRRVLLAFLSGGLGMLSETLLMLQYQVKSGALFQDIGVLLTAFMAGLALGAPAMLNLYLRSSGRPVQRVTGLIPMAGFAGLLLLTALGIRTEALAGLPVFGLLMFLSGLMGSAIFAYAGLLAEVDPQQLISPLLAADLLGGCVGCLVSSLVLIPFMGLDASAVLGAGMAAVAALLV